MLLVRVGRNRFDPKGDVRVAIVCSRIPDHHNATVYFAVKQYKLVRVGENQKLADNASAIDRLFMECLLPAAFMVYFVLHRRRHSAVVGWTINWLHKLQKAC